MGYVEESVKAIIFLVLFSSVFCFDPDATLNPHDRYIALVIFQLVIAGFILLILYETTLPVYENAFGRFGFAVYTFVATAVALSYFDCHSNFCGVPSLLDILAQTLCHVFFGSAPCPLLQ